MGQKIIHNRIRCKICGDIIESRHRHDFVRCKCGACFTDGGHDYIRRGWEAGLTEIPYEEMDEFEDGYDIRQKVNMIK